MNVNIINSAIFLNDDDNNFSMLVEFNLIIQGLRKSSSSQQANYCILAEVGLLKLKYFKLIISSDKVIVYQKINDEHEVILICD